MLNDLPAITECNFVFFPNFIFKWKEDKTPEEVHELWDK